MPSPNDAPRVEPSFVDVELADPNGDALLVGENYSRDAVVRRGRNPRALLSSLEANTTQGDSDE